MSQIAIFGRLHQLLHSVLCGSVLHSTALFCFGQQITTSPYNETGIDEPRPQTAIRRDEATNADLSVKPVPRTDANSRIAHQQLVEKAKQGRIDVYFVGDSITRRWGASDPQYKHLLENWNKNFFGWNAANFGWGGDTVQNVLWRLKNGELAGVHPKVIVISAGTNNVASKPGNDAVVAEVSHGIKAIIDECRKQAPNATIILTAVFPRNDDMSFMPMIHEINHRIAKYAEGKRVRFLNLNETLADRNGRLFDGMTDDDKLHLGVKGYQVWADGLKPILHDVLGPPANVDHAPPPTGDPSIISHAAPILRTPAPR